MLGSPIAAFAREFGFEIHSHPHRIATTTFREPVRLVAALSEVAGSKRPERDSGSLTRAASSFVSAVDLRQATYALKVALAAVLTLWIAFLFNLEETFWALLTLPLVVRPQSGAMVWRSAARLGGTLIGTLVALLLVGSFAQSAPAMIAALCLWIFGTGYLAHLQSGLDSYAYGVAGLTAMVIAIDTGPDATEVYGYALARTTETAIAIICGFMVLLTVFPHSVAEDVEAKIAAARTLILEIGRNAVADRPQANLSTRKRAIALLLAINTDLRAQSYERSRRNLLLPRWTSVAQSLTRMAIEAEGARRALCQMERHERSDILDAARRRLEQVLAEFPVRRANAAQALRDAEVVRAVQKTIDPKLASDAIRDLPEGAEEATLHQAALSQLRLFAGAIHDLLLREAALLDPRLPMADPAPVGARYPDFLAACEYGLRPTIVFLCCAILWLTTASPNGAILTLLAGAFSLALPTIVPRTRRVRSGLLIALGLFTGAVISLALMAFLSDIEGFGRFALIIGATMFTVFYLAGGPETLPLALGVTIMIAIGLQPANEQQYDAIRLINNLAALALMPVAFVAGLTIVFPENQNWLKRHLRRGTRDLLRRSTAPGRPMDEDAFFEQMVDLLGDYGNDLSDEDREARHLIARATTALLAGLQCYRMRRLSNSADLPKEVAAHAPELIAAVRRASERPAETAAAASQPFVELRLAIRNRIRRRDLREEAHLAVLRFGASAELCHSLVLSGELAPSRPGHAGAPLAS